MAYEPPIDHGPSSLLDRTAKRQFPILWSCFSSEMARLAYALKGEEPIPTHVPFSLVERHHGQCRRNHGQTPEELAKRGGLAVDELVAVFEDRSFSDMPLVDAVRSVNAFVREAAKTQTQTQSRIGATCQCSKNEREIKRLRAVIQRHYDDAMANELACSQYAAKSAGEELSDTARDAIVAKYTKRAQRAIMGE